MTTFVEARWPGRNALEASAGFRLSYEDPIVFPQKEAEGFFPAPSTEKSTPYDSKRSVVASGPSMGRAFTLPLFSKG
ncbi:MAG: hypothetical protein ABH969_06830 [Pseudomonadota bacterium]